MLETSGLISMAVFLAVFMATAGAVLYFFIHFHPDRRRTLARLRDLAPEKPAELEPSGVGERAFATLPKVGTLLVPSREKERTSLQARLWQCGFYNPEALRVFLGVKLLLLVIMPLACGVIPRIAGLLSGRDALVAGGTALAAAFVAPGLWLDWQRRRRQSALRRGLPDALDMIVLCLEGGVSLLAAIQRVTGELQVAHPVLAGEMNIVLREIQLGQSPGQAFKKLGGRCDLEEVRDLASVLLQSEHYGASIVKALRVHADTCRVARQQRAEELAQKAAVKILFPTLLCIFPAIFIVVLGPAARQLSTMFSRMH